MYENVEFEPWLGRVFPNEATEYELDVPSIHPELNLKYCLRLFSKPDIYLSGNTDISANKGLWYLAREGSSEFSSLYECHIELTLRLSLIESIYTHFENYIQRRCAHTLGHLDEAGARPLNSVCYMWWDLFPSWGRPQEKSSQMIDDACLHVMERVLKLDSIACQESALHGLGHWHISYPKRCESIVDGFLSTKISREELRDYAEAARMGCVQ